MPEVKNYKEALQNPIFDTLSIAAKTLHVECYVIGGFVRDFLLDRGIPKDIDVVAIGNGIALANEVSKLLPKKPKVTVFKT
ncbi:MAG: tRNA nucleotidyltransferase, partial [Flavobacteriales bacterium]|nr:tRNA nucleotidyltransferase [Flavobacteriales bacterium]